MKPSSCVIFLPGLVCDTEVWHAQLEAVRSWAVGSVADYGTLNSLTDMAKRVLDQASDTFVLIGHSMGARVALEFVRIAPQRVTGLALLSTGYQALPAGEIGERERTQRLALLALAQEQGMRAMAARWLSDKLAPSRQHDEALREAIIAMMGGKSAAIFAAQIQALLARPDAEPLLRTIECPTLVLCGCDDNWSPPAVHQEIVKRVPHGKMVVLEDCGHMAPMERPAEVNAALLEWLHAP